MNCQIFKADPKTPHGNVEWVILSGLGEYVQFWACDNIAPIHAIVKSAGVFFMGGSLV